MTYAELDAKPVLNVSEVARLKGVSAPTVEGSGKEQAKDVGAWIRRGLSVEQMKTEEVREAEWMCKCEKVKRPSEQTVLI